MAPYWRVWVFFCFSWRTVKKKQKSKPLCLASLQGGARYPHRERQQCEVKEVQLQIGRLSLFFRWTKEGKKNREEHSCFALFSCCTCTQERGSGQTSIHSPWPCCHSPFQEDIWPALTPLLPPFLLHTGLQQLKLAEPVVVMISCS